MTCIENLPVRVYLTISDVLFIHRRLVLRYGGTDGILSPNELSSAVMRASSGYYHGIAEEAAALAESLLVNHPFRDGNKRTAFASADVFLRINGFVIESDDRVLCDMVYSWLATQNQERFSLMVRDLMSLLQPGFEAVRS